MAKLFLDAGVIVLTAFVSPSALTDKARGLVEDGDFLEVFCAADLDVCESRDPKGLYAKARARSRIHRHLQPLRSAGDARAEDRHRQAGSGRPVELVIKALQERGVIPAA